MSKMPHSQSWQLILAMDWEIHWRCHLESTHVTSLCVLGFSENFKSEWSNNHKQKLKCFLWPHLGTPRISCHLQHIQWIKLVIKTSPDWRVSTMDSTSWWGVARSHCRRVCGMRYCCVHLWEIHSATELFGAHHCFAWVLCHSHASLQALPCW